MKADDDGARRLRWRLAASRTSGGLQRRTRTHRAELHLLVLLYAPLLPIARIGLVAASHQSSSRTSRWGLSDWHCRMQGTSCSRIRPLVSRAINLHSSSTVRPHGTLLPGILCVEIAEGEAVGAGTRESSYAERRECVCRDGAEVTDAWRSLSSRGKNGLNFRYQVHVFILAVWVIFIQSGRESFRPARRPGPRGSRCEGLPQGIYARDVPPIL